MMVRPVLPLDLLACPACSGDLGIDGTGELVCRACHRGFSAGGGIPNLSLPADARSEAVRAFYAAAPFPGYPPQLSLSSLRARAARNDFARLLDQAIPPGARVLELGCGTGQMCLYLAAARRRVVGADLSLPALELGAAAARHFGVAGVQFVETDLRAPGLRAGAFDVVYASGVLHHTPDPRASFAAICRLARPGGILVIGLYHLWARLPHRLRRAVARLSGYRFIPFDPVLRARRYEPARRQAWLRDQYQHPLEHRHTLGEVQRWFRECGVEYLRAYPSALLAAPPLEGAQLFEPAGDDWAPERWLTQLGWTAALAHEGGLFIAIGRAGG